MLFLLQNVLYCLMFIFPVKCAVRNNGLNCLYFYPTEFIEEAQKRGIADKDAVMKKGKRFMIPFCIFIFLKQRQIFQTVHVAKNQIRCKILTKSFRIQIQSFKSRISGNNVVRLAFFKKRLCCFWRRSFSTGKNKNIHR